MSEAGKPRPSGRGAVTQPVQKWTWGDLATAVAFGWVGPLLPAAVLLKIVIEAKFWKRRIFPNRRI